MIYYIADIHFSDQAIFDKCKRPFKDVNEFNNTIITNWKKKVTDLDTVYVLGDLCDENSLNDLEKYRNLPGEKHLIVGNHDHSFIEKIKESKIFKTVKFIDVINDDNRKVCICHYPLMDWMEFNRKGLLVYGHIHNKTEANGIAYKQIKEYYKDKPAYNCGVDVTNYEPVTLDEMIKLKEVNKHEAYIN